MPCACSRRGSAIGTTPCAHQLSCRHAAEASLEKAVPLSQAPCNACRAAFSFVYGSSAQPAASGPLGVLAGLFGGSRTKTAAELPATDMRALDSLEDTLRKAGVLNK